MKFTFAITPYLRILNKHVISQKNCVYIVVKKIILTHKFDLKEKK